MGLPCCHWLPVLWRWWSCAAVKEVLLLPGFISVATALAAELGGKLSVQFTLKFCLKVLVVMFREAGAG